MQKTKTVRQKTDMHNRKRLFFALWPPREVAMQIFSAAKMLPTSANSSLVRREQLHLTMAFLDTVSNDRLADVCRAANQAITKHITCFNLHLNRFGQFRKNGIVWLGTDHPPKAMLSLAAELADKLQTAGFHLDAKQFAAHVTLLRKTKHQLSVTLPRPSIFWQVEDMALTESQLTASSSRYQILYRWPLAAS